MSERDEWTTEQVWAFNRKIYDQWDVERRQHNRAMLGQLIKGIVIGILLPLLYIHIVYGPDGFDATWGLIADEFRWAWEPVWNVLPAAGDLPWAEDWGPPLTKFLLYGGHLIVGMIVGLYLMLWRRDYVSGGILAALCAWLLFLRLISVTS